MAGNGLWSKLSCEEGPSASGGVDLKFEGSTQPAPPASGGTSTKFAGVMHPDGRVEGEVVQTDNGSVERLARTDGTGVNSIPLPAGKTLADVARDTLSPPAQACRKALTAVPGVSG